MKKENEIHEVDLRFLVKVKTWGKIPDHGTLRKITLAYLSSSSKRVVRLLKIGKEGYLTIKGEKSNCDDTLKWTFKIPSKQVDEMLQQPKLFGEGALPIMKIRYQVPDHVIQWKGTSLVWAIDEFHGRNEGLLLAELKFRKLKSVEEKCQFEALVRANLPGWVGRELNLEKDESLRRYLNYHLSQIPFSCWPNPWKKDMLEHHQL